MLLCALCCQLLSLQGLQVALQGALQGALQSRHQAASITRPLQGQECCVCTCSVVEWWCCRLRVLCCRLRVLCLTCRQGLHPLPLPGLLFSMCVCEWCMWEYICRCVLCILFSVCAHEFYIDYIYTKQSLHYGVFRQECCLSLCHTNLLETMMKLSRFMIDFGAEFLWTDGIWCDLTLTILMIYQTNLLKKQRVHLLFWWYIKLIC